MLKCIFQCRLHEKCGCIVIFTSRCSCLFVRCYLRSIECRLLSCEQYKCTLIRYLFLIKTLQGDYERLEQTCALCQFHVHSCQTVI